MVRLGVLFLVLGPAIVTSAKVRSLRHEQSLHGVGLSSRRELREMGKDGLQARITALEEEVGQLEVAMEKSSKKNAASISELQKELNATTAKFPDKLPWRTEEQKLKAKIRKIEDQIAETHQQILAHGDVAERSRTELETLVQQGAKCKCKGAGKEKVKKISLLQTEGRPPRHLSEDEIAAMVNDLTGLTFDMATQTSAVEGAKGAPDESVAVEGLVRKAEELQRRRSDLQAQQVQAAKKFEEERSKLLEQFQAASRKLSAAKVKAVQEEQNAKERQRTLTEQHTYASAILTQQVNKLEKLNTQMADYGARIKELSDLVKTCGCLAEDAAVWMPPAKVTTTTTTVAPQVGLVRESRLRSDSAQAEVKASSSQSALPRDTVLYNSWDVDMELEKLQDANIKIYEAQANDLKVMRRTCGFTAGSNASADVYNTWCYPGSYWGMSKYASDFGEGAVNDMIVHPPNRSEGNELLLLRFEVPHSGQYTLDLFGARSRGDGLVDALLFVNDEERIVLKNLANAELPTTTNGMNIVHNLGQLAAGDYLYFAIRGDGMADVKLRFRIIGVIGVKKAATESTTTSTSTLVCNCQEICTKVQGAVVPPTAACEEDGCNSNCRGFGCGFKCAAEACASNCQGELCGYHCEGKECASNCTGSACGRRCKQTSCGERCAGTECSSECQGRNCGKSCEGYRCAYKCVGYQCAKGCVGVECGYGCEGEECASDCVGENCNGDCQGKDCDLAEKPLQLVTTPVTPESIACDCDCSGNVAVQGFAYVEGPKLSNLAQVQCDAEGAEMGSIEDIAHRCGSFEHCHSLFDYNCDGIAWRNCRSSAARLQNYSGDSGACSRLKQAGWLLFGTAQRGVQFARPYLESASPVSAMRMDIDSISVRAVDVTMKKVFGLTSSAADDETFQEGGCLKLLPAGTGGVVELPDGSKKDYSNGDVFTVNLGQKGFEFFQNDILLGSWSTEKLPGQLLAKLWLFDQHSSLEVLQACKNVEGSYISDAGPVVVNQRGCAITVNQQGSGAVSGVVSGNSLMLGAVGYSQDGDILFENGSQWKRQS
mmetsp:Transcript_24151/g.50133  ORF Transcript_24151/g.50133 Transcript_24151/m.50133 type:complete len:1054 (+) Transcript_24151:76-3237(+)